MYFNYYEPFVFPAYNLMFSIKVQNINLKEMGNDINHLKLIREKNLNDLVVAHLNITSISNKF